MTKELNILELTKQNFALYGISIEYHPDQSVSKEEFRDICKLDPCIDGVSRDGKYVTPDSFNAQEMYESRVVLQNNSSRMHMLFVNEYGGDKPTYVPHDPGIPPGVYGLTGHTGSPTERTLDEVRTPYGVVMLTDSIPSDEEAAGVLTHELGHAFGAGWLDDSAASTFECYSGDTCVTGGNDQTPETIVVNGEARSDETVMSRSPAFLRESYFVFSIEEASTIDTEDIPSKDD